MFTATCKCGKTSMTFRNLKAKDFGPVWVTDCCEEAEKEQKKPEIKEEIKKEEKPKPQAKKKRRSRKKKSKAQKVVIENVKGNSSI